MAIRQLTFNFLLYLCTGTFASFAFVRKEQVGPRYFLYHGLGIAFLMGITFFLGSGRPHLVNYALGGFILFSILYSLYATFSPSLLPKCLFTVALGLALGVITHDLYLNSLHSASSERIYLLGLNAFLSIGLLGFTMAAMLLGHWYLIEPKLSIGELKRLSLGFILFSGVRFLFGTLLLGQRLSGLSEIEIYRFLFSSSTGIFILMRWTWGLLGPVLLAYMVWHTVKIRSTQSATGILYVAVLCVLTGEILNQYLTQFLQLPF